MKHFLTCSYCRFAATYSANYSTQQGCLTEIKLSVSTKERQGYRVHLINLSLGSPSEIITQTFISLFTDRRP